MLRKPQRLEPTPAQRWGEADAEIRAKIAQDAAERAEIDRKRREFYDNLYHSDGSDSSEEEQTPPPKKRRLIIITRSMKEARERQQMMLEDERSRAMIEEEEDNLPIAVVFGLTEPEYVPIIDEELNEETTVAEFLDIFETRSQASLLPSDNLSDFGDDLYENGPVGKKRGQPFKPPPQRLLPRGLPGRITFRTAIDTRTGLEFPPNKKGECLSIGSDGKIYAVGELEKARILTPKYRNVNQGGWIHFGTRYTKNGKKAGVQIFLCHIA